MKGLAVYLGLAERSERTLAESFRAVGAGHAAEADVYHACRDLAAMSDDHVERLGPVVARYGEERDSEPERLHADGVAEVRSGPVGLLRDLQDLSLLASLVQSTWTVLLQAGRGARDEELVEAAQHCLDETARQLAWLSTRLKQAAPQALLAAR